MRRFEVKIMVWIFLAIIVGLIVLWFVTQGVGVQLLGRKYTLPRGISLILPPPSRRTLPWATAGVCSITRRTRLTSTSGARGAGVVHSTVPTRKYFIVVGLPTENEGYSNLI